MNFMNVLCWVHNKLIHLHYRLFGEYPAPTKLGRPLEWLLHTLDVWITDSKLSWRMAYEEMVHERNQACRDWARQEKRIEHDAYFISECAWHIKRLLDEANPAGDGYGLTPTHIELYEWYCVARNDYATRARMTPHAHRIASLWGGVDRTDAEQAQHVIDSTKSFSEWMAAMAGK